MPHVRPYGRQLTLFHDPRMYRESEWLEYEEQTYRYYGYPPFGFSMDSLLAGQVWPNYLEGNYNWALRRVDSHEGWSETLALGHSKTRKGAMRAADREAKRRWGA